MKLKAPTDTKGVKIDFEIIRANLRAWAKQDAERKTKEEDRKRNREKRYPYQKG